MSLTSASSCAKCGTGLERGATRCVACGAEVAARRPAGPPPRPPGRPPAPERAASTVVTSASEVVTSARLPEPAPAPAANPFLAPIAAPSEPSIELASNPFLGEPVAPAASAPRPAVATDREPARPVIAAPRVAAPLRVDPNVAVPNIRDPHAEFRRGSWKKPLAFVVAAAAILAGLSLLGREKSEKVAVDLGEPVKVRAGIGTSLPPHRTSEESDLAPETAKHEATESERPPGDLGRSRDAAGESGFAKAFKEAAKR